MSWILGCWGRPCLPELVARLKAFTASERGRLPSVLHEIEASGGWALAGGLAATCYAGATRADALPGASTGAWLAVGLALEPADGGYRALRNDAWAGRLQRAAPNLEGLSGHFAAVRWTADAFWAGTDALGLRTLYLKRMEGGWVYSTRADALARFAGGAVDLEAFGSHWLTFNQLSYRSLVAGLERLGPGSTVRIDERGPKWSAAPFHASGAPKATGAEQLEKALREAVRPAAQRASLGLSGGLDSRVLLGLLRQQQVPFATHVFGPDADPDVRVARRIAGDLGLVQRHFDAALPSSEAALQALKDYAAEACATAPATAALKLTPHYRQLEADGFWMIDGGFGEIARRQYFNRLRRRGAAALRAGRLVDVAGHLRVPRAAIFNQDARRLMEQGIVQDLKALQASMPRPSDIGLADYLDLLALRVRLPNFFGYEQARLDGLIPNYMPFAQPAVLRAVFQVPPSQRRGGRLLRRLLRRHAPRLARYPLVKGGTTYPFGLGPVPALLWTGAKARFGNVYQDAARHEALHHLADPVRDLAHSAAVRQYAPYDVEKITGLVTRFYGGQAGLAYQVDWWLAFELWRQGLEHAYAV